MTTKSILEWIKEYPQTRPIFHANDLHKRTIYFSTALFIGDWRKGNYQELSELYQTLKQNGQ